MRHDLLVSKIGLGRDIYVRPLPIVKPDPDDSDRIAKLQTYRSQLNRLSGLARLLPATNARQSITLPAPAVRTRE